jgi:predicted glycogen debranching enzyme
MRLTLPSEVCIDPAQSASLEWLETNGTGSFASGTVSGIHTRRYHGLLTAALHPPVGRTVLVSKLEETLETDNQIFELSANQYPGAVAPQGFLRLAAFRLDPYPVWLYRCGKTEVEKRVLMIHGEDTVLVEYTLRGNIESAKLRVRPLIAFREYHSLTRANGGINPNFTFEAGVISLQPYADLPRLYFATNAASCAATAHWYHNFQYAEESRRGLDFEEDLFQPFELHFPEGAQTAAIALSLRRVHPAEIASLRNLESARRESLRAQAPSHDTLIADLTEAADQFLVARNGGHTVIAGYPWFADWGRDTMIALPGLTLSTGRHEAAQQILSEFARAMNQGMLPNRFPDFGEAPEYNTVDATLWMFEAVRAYLAHTGDTLFVRGEIYPKLVEAVECHLRGTRYGIQAGDDGLLNAGEPGVQLTWMDAKIDDWVVTPRHGKPVEIQALWYNALCVLESLARKFGDPQRADFLKDFALHAAHHFRKQFWNPDGGCLCDVVTPNGPDASIRPNMIFAASLHHSMLSKPQMRAVVNTVREHLLTPLGLRSLSPSDPAYRPRYEGGVWERDSAYHQGTIWPWLIGPYFQALRKVEPASNEPAEWLANFARHLRTAGLGQVYEVASADAPHTPGGCPAQAWSVAEILRAALEHAAPKSKSASAAAD